MTANTDTLREALEFYADRQLDGYDVMVTDYGLSTREGHIIRDGGEIARAALAEAQQGEGKWERFGRWVVEVNTFLGADLDGYDVQNKAVELGILIEVEFDPDKHDADNESIGVERGDSWFVFADDQDSGPVDGDKELTDTALPMVRAALQAQENKDE
jgi:hypothetical protein